LGSYEKALQAEVAKVPYLMLERAIQEKLEAAGAPECERAAKEIVLALREGRDPDIRWETADDEPDRTIDISINDQDMDEILEATKSFYDEGLTSLIAEMRDTAAKRLVKRLKRDWPEQWAWQEHSLEQFRENLEARWGGAFKYLRMMLTISREMGGELLKKRRRSRSRKKQHVWDVLARLHTRGCQITAEILTLMENGFADGAMARWRTLYEIGVVASLISEHGEELAKRYLDHEAVEAKRALDIYQKYHSELGFDPYDEEEAKEVQRRFEELRDQYGKPFTEQYGWAAEHLGIHGRSFADLEEKAGKASMRSYYKMASYNVHAGTKGIVFRLGLFGREGFLAGASNAGFLDPAQNTAFTLTQLTGEFIHREMGFDEQLLMQVLLHLRDQIGPALRKAEKKLEDDERNYQKERRRIAKKRREKRASKQASAG